LLAFVVTLIALASGSGFLVRGRDGIEAGTYDGPRDLGRAPDDGSSGPDDSTDHATLKHQRAREDGGSGGGTSEDLDHEASLVRSG
jgi:hypothetical protein